MTDCPNATMRDLLPDLLHERLDASTRAAVRAHVDGCEDCRAELALLSNVEQMLMKQTPRVDVNYIVGALPLAPARRARTLATPRRRWADWRIAAAVAVLAVGGTSVAVLERSSDIIVATDTMRASQSNSVAPVPSASTNAAAATPVPNQSVSSPSESHAPTRSANGGQVAASNEGIGVGGRIGDLNQKQLRTLLDDIDNMEAVPITEPEPVSLKVEGTRSSSSLRSPEDM